MSLEQYGFTPKATLYTSARTLVQRAVRNSDGQHVIIKQPAMGTVPETEVDRFAYAYDIQHRFDHSGITRALDWVSLGNCHGLVLEDIGAQPLTAFVDSLQGAPVAIELFLTIAIQLAGALGEIHHRHVIHKDLHPGNIVIEPVSGRVQITDFDIASLLSREQPALQPPEELEGNLAFISPEQTGRMNRALDYRTDFYSLGVTLYWLLTGKMPFAVEGSIAMVHAHIARLPIPVRTLRPDLPDMLSRIIEKLLAKNAEDRYQSAEGLKFDLEHCLDQWRAQQRIDEFEPGQHDISSQFQISQKLYGRETEIGCLLSAFDRARDGSPQLFVVQGYSGIGKSSLVYEAHKAIAAHGGWFASGKFEPFTRNIPYSALHSALNTWLQAILAEGKESLTQRREFLRRELGNNGRVLIDFQPELELLLGDLPEPPVLGARESQIRLQRVIQQFIQVITQEQTLVLFLDDIQWADPGTLGLLQVLMADIGSRLLLIVAYRDNEVSETHPAFMALQGIREEIGSDSPRLEQVTLAPLSYQDIYNLLHDTLLNDLDVAALAQLVEEKTAGNPFFINEFLRTLYSENLINFVAKRRCWEWDLQRIREQNITDNVVELMLGKMRRLPADTQHYLQLAACIGSSFDLQLLILVTQSQRHAVADKLWPALQEGLVQVESGDWILRTGTESNGSETGSLRSSGPELQLRFVHDRMWQAAMESMDESVRIQTHLTIGRFLLSKRDDGQRFDLFAVVEHLNEARLLVVDPEEKLALCRLNVDASRQAKSSSAWSAATRFVRVALELLPADAWQQYYELVAQIHILAVECEYLSANIEAAQQLSGHALQHLQDGFEKAAVCHLRVKFDVARGSRLETIQYGLNGLRYCGIPIADLNNLDDAIIEERQRLLQKSWNKTIEERIAIVGSASPQVAVAGALFADLLIATIVMGEKQLNVYLGYKGAQFLMEHGLCNETAPTLSQYLLVLIRLGQQDEAFELSKRALEFLDSGASVSVQSHIYLPLGLVVWHNHFPLEESINQLWKGYHAGMESGEMNTGFACFSNLTFGRFAKGEELSEIANHAQQIIAMMNTYRMHVSGGKQYLRLVNMLRDPKLENQLIQSAYSPAEWAIVENTSLKAVVLHLRQHWWFWSDQRMAGLQELPDAERTLDLIPGWPQQIDHLILKGLLLAGGVDIAPHPPGARAAVKPILDALTLAAQRCPSTYEHKRLLLAAEMARLNADLDGAIRGYRQAVQSARQHGFQQYEALGHEYLGRLLWQQGWQELALVPLRSAHYVYGRWGCKVKQVTLEKAFPSVFAATVIPGLRISPSSLFSTTTTHDSGTARVSAQLDIESVLKATRTISSELVLNRLLENLLHIMVENAGAQTAVLILNRDEQLMEEARLELDVQGNHVNSVIEPALKPVNPRNLPQELIRYVLLTDKPLLLQDVAASATWRKDEYFSQQKVRSVLCLPIHYRDNLTGALYLENRLTTHAFTDDRLQVLELLLAQASISLENARLFDEVQVLNASLEQKVQQRTADLEALNRELEAFSYSVSHDLRGPLRNINGFSKMLLVQHGHTMAPEGRDLLDRIGRNTDKMSNLISGLLMLSKVTRSELQLVQVDLAEMANAIIEEMKLAQPQRQIEWKCSVIGMVRGDARLLHSVMENLLSNAWKYSSKIEHPVLEFGCMQNDEQTVYFVRDNGAGFDMRYADKLFNSFQRLHSDKEFAGTGIGLATVRRIIRRHGGDIWAEAQIDKGATFYFTLAN